MEIESYQCRTVGTVVVFFSGHHAMEYGRYEVAMAVSETFSLEALVPSR